MKSSYVVGVIALVLIVGSGILVYRDAHAPLEAPKPHVASALDGFATCLKDAGATFYGAFWCPHCKAQKALFAGSVDLLPYVECSSADGKSQTQVCKDKNVESYPTWVFKDGTRLTGEVPLETLGQKTACTLPNSATSTNP